MTYEDAAFKQQQTFKLKSGTTLVLSQLGMQDFVTLRQMALKDYRREKITAVTDNIEFIPEDNRDAAIQDVIRRAEEVTTSNLPKQEINWPLRDEKGRLLINDDGITPRTREVTVPYEIWWLSETPEGKLHAAWLSIRAVQGQEKTTIDEVDELFRDAMDELEQVANVVGEMSGPKIGDPRSKKQERRLARERRRKRREKKRRTGR